MRTMVAIVTMLCACAPGAALDDGTDVCIGDACMPGSEGGGSTGEPLPGSSEGGDPPALEDDGGSPSTGLPCAVLDVLRNECHECHADPPAFGGPMPLADYDDLMVPSVSDPARSVRELVAERLVAEMQPMPPGGEIADDDRQVLLDWIAAGAPEDPDSDCGDWEPSNPVDELPCEPDAFFLAHDAADPDAPFAVPAVGADNLYMCFSFEVPFEPGAQATAWAPVIDDERVIHHIMFYKSALPVGEGVYPCTFVDQLAHQFVAMWAPGGSNLVMPDDAGIGLDAGGYIMQIHYNNQAKHEGVLDRSGLAMCTTSEPREHTAGSVTLGTFAILLPPGAQEFPVTGRCGTERTLLWPEEVNVAFQSPHMHKLGRKFSTKALRLENGGVVEHPIVDVPNFDFNQHKSYVSDPPFVIHRGDELRTTCTFDNPNPWPVLFGEDTDAEMCLNFMLVYPFEGVIDQNCGVVL